MAQAADLDAVGRGANAIPLPAKDDGGLYLPDHLRPTDVRGTPGHAGPVQLCMDIRAAGGRYLEQAENLRKEVLRY